MTQKIKSNKYVFIDTNIFLDILYSDTSSDDLDKILKEINSKKITLLVPKVIQMEVLKDFAMWKKNFLESIAQKLKIDLILDVTEKDKTGTGKDRKKKNNNTLLIDNLTKDSRDELVRKVSDFYTEIEDKLRSIFGNGNTKIIELSDSIIIKGIERSLLKKAPSTKLDKKTEHQHMKDVDCIAFESVLHFFSENKLSSYDIFHIFTTDSDYFDEDKLRDDIKNDLSKFKDKNIYHSQIAADLFVKKSNAKKIKESVVEPSLFSSDQGLVESSENLLSK